ncbi:MAG: hypothetical protein QM655_04310 [Nocardioidaceae bacterium]
MGFKMKLAMSVSVLALGVGWGVAGAAAMDGDLQDDSQRSMGCRELAENDSQNLEYERIYDPATGDLTVIGESGTYDFNVNDVECRGLPQVAILIDDVLNVYETNQEEECAGIAEELKALDADLLEGKDLKIDSPKGEMDLDALVRYSEEVCGGDVPGLAGR